MRFSTALLGKDLHKISEARYYVLSCNAATIHTTSECNEVVQLLKGFAVGKEPKPTDDGSFFNTALYNFEWQLSTESGMFEGRARHSGSSLYGGNTSQRTGTGNQMDSPCAVLIFMINSLYK